MSRTDWYLLIFSAEKATATLFFLGRTYVGLVDTLYALKQSTLVLVGSNHFFET